MILTGKTEELGETCPCANFSTTDPTWTETEANPALAVRSQGLTACAMGRSIRDSYQDQFKNCNYLPQMIVIVNRL
jgi:hypothetical protein